MTIYAARCVLPMDGTIVEDGEVVVDEGVVVDVRPGRSPANEKIDLGNAVILPGLINAHTHLEYTALRGFLEDVPFFTWIRALTAIKAHLSADDWIASAKLGALECLASGTTTIGDNTDTGAAMDAALWSGLRGRIYQEFFCIDHRTDPAKVAEELACKIAALEAHKGDRLQVGVSPHATYTINSAMFAVLRQDERLRHWPSSIHTAESPAETALIRFGSGPFADMFERRGIEWQSPHVSPTRYVFDQGAMHANALLVHCVHQEDGDLELVSGSGAAIVHCPKSNAKLGAGAAPLARWLAYDGLKLGIGTDSAVSNNALDLFEEMRFALLLQRAVKEDVSAVTALDVLKLATTRGADALGLSSVGILLPGKTADLIAVSLDGLHLLPASDPATALVYSARGSDVTLTVIGGDVRYRNGQFPDLDVSVLRRAAADVNRKLAETTS